ncbi:Bax inhibitor-1 family protein [Desulfoluna butyratoxydans]|uniref:Bax inhibitor 1-related n=1 Tax=Desulfoluna butyratoxydans TaxID=231438 RepID=A0A4U8YSH8_9BACT|nr:Bax inhibitor-1 family protein [Desulfoluna butyratoxydans]VFQ47326.1 bax inhibitor 1-related [Desulfoluna butyratoxydans]
MENVLLSKVFFILSGMLLITSFFARINKAYETTGEAIFTIAGSFFFIFVIMGTAEKFPANLFSVAIFSGFIGWSLGPTIGYIGNRYKFRKFLKSKEIKSKQIVTEKRSFIAKLFGAEDEKKTVFFSQKNKNEYFDSKDKRYLAIEIEFDNEVLSNDKYNQEWQNIVFLALFGTTMAVFAAGTVNYLFDLDFGFLGHFLFISLCTLITISLLNTFIFRARMIRVYQSFFGIIIFTLYLLYDINILEKKMTIKDSSWSTSIDIAVNIYLDVINLFIRLLEILAEFD